MLTSVNQPLVVVFGGAGYIGSVLVRKLIAQGFHVRIFDNFLFGNHGISDLEAPGVEIIKGDIADTCAVSHGVSGAEAVILLASIVGRRIFDVQSPVIRDINLLASSVVLDAAVEHGANRFLFASTDSVYGVQSGTMYETGMPDPISLYSRLKLRMEERVISARSRYFHPTALRIATCHGLSPRMRFDLLANTMVRDAVCRKEITVVGGEQVRPLIHVDDVASAFVACLNAHTNLVSGEIFNVGAKDQNVQVKQVANLVNGLVPEAKMRFVEAEADLVDYDLSSSKIEKILDFRPVWTLEESLLQVRDLLLHGHFEDPYNPMYQNT